MSTTNFQPDVLTESSVLTFGKYKGNTLQQILDQKEATYLRWCIENVAWFKVGRGLKRKIRVQAEREERDSSYLYVIDPYDFCDHD